MKMVPNRLVLSTVQNLSHSSNLSNQRVKRAKLHSIDSNWIKNFLHIGFKLINVYNLHQQIFKWTMKTQLKDD